MNLDCPICFEKIDGIKIKPITLLPCQHTICSRCQENFGNTDFYLDIFKKKFINNDNKFFSYNKFLNFIKKKIFFLQIKFRKCPFCQNMINFKILNHSVQILILRKNNQICDNEKCKELVDENFLINYYDYENTLIFCSLDCSGPKSCSPIKLPNCFSYFLTDVSKNLIIFEKIYEIFQNRSISFVMKKIRKKKKIIKMRFSHLFFDKNYMLLNLIYDEKKKNKNNFYNLENFSGTNLNLVKKKFLEDYDKIKKIILKFSNKINNLEKKKKREMKIFKKKEKAYYSDSKINYAFYRFLNRNFFLYKKFFTENVLKNNSEFFLRINNLKKYIFFNKGTIRFFGGIIGQYKDFIIFKINKLNKTLLFCDIDDIDSKRKILKRIKYYRNLKIEIINIFENINFHFDYKTKLNFKKIIMKKKNNLEIKKKEKKIKKIKKEKKMICEEIKNIEKKKILKKKFVDKLFFKNRINISLDSIDEKKNNSSFYNDFDFFTKNTNNSIMNDDSILSPTFLFGNIDSFRD